MTAPFEKQTEPGKTHAYIFGFHGFPPLQPRSAGNEHTPEEYRKFQFEWVAVCGAVIEPRDYCRKGGSTLRIFDVRARAWFGNKRFAVDCPECRREVEKFLADDDRQAELYRAQVAWEGERLQRPLLPPLPGF